MSARPVRLKWRADGSLAKTLLGGHHQVGVKVESGAIFCMAYLHIVPDLKFTY